MISGGVEIACNDDRIGLQSALQVVLAAGQTVIVVVDGYASNSGDFVLDIQ